MSEQMNRANGDQATRPSDVVEIDLKRLLRAVLDKIWVIGISALLCAALAFGYTHYFITPQYQSSAMFYVNNNSLSVGSASLSLTANDLAVAKNLVDSYIVILKSRTSLNDVIDYTGIDRSYGELKGMISAADVNSTEIFEVVVTSPDPNEAEQIANAIAYILPKRISSIIEGSSAKVVDYAIVPSSPSSPSYPKNTIMGLFLGLVLSAAVIVLREIFDVTIRAEEDIEQCCHHPILAAVPDMTAHSKGGYYGAYNIEKRSKKKSAASDKEVILSGDGISFAAAEAYKLLRTKLQFSFTDESNCRVIGVSSAMVGEGKSLTSVNLAYSLAQLDKRILLIDCDMRRPSVASKLPIQKFPGLSNCLAGHTRLDEVIQSSGTEIGTTTFDVISAGRTPPNPMELLSSEKMQKVVNRLRDFYDYIILDLPPVGEVSDAMAVAGVMDGVLLIARQNYGNRVAFSSAVKQFEFTGVKILGVVLNRAADGSEGKKYYKRYGYYSRNGYYSKYKRSYMEAAEKAASEQQDKQ